MESEVFVNSLEVVIKTEFEEKPAAWSNDWNFNNNQVVWGFKQ